MMAQRLFLMEPGELRILRGTNGNERQQSSKHAATNRGMISESIMVRSAGDGMEFERNRPAVHNTTQKNYSEEEINFRKPMAASTPLSKKLPNVKNNVLTRNMKDILHKVENNRLSATSSEEKPILSINCEEELKKLRLEVSQLQNTNKRLTDEKVKLSTQLGLQSQVNSELKNLLVASIGADLGEKLEQMAFKKVMTEEEVKMLLVQLEEKTDKLESLVIQCDVWRSKFLGSRVMADELTSWKVLTDAKYRECSSALETLLEEHLQVATTISSSNRFLLKLLQLISDTHLENEATHLSTIDLAVTNHILAKTATERVIESSRDKSLLKGKKEETRVPMKQYCGLSAGEQRAKKVLEDALKEDPNASKQRKDMLTQNRISQILATKYAIRCLTCKGCKGAMQTV